MAENSKIEWTDATIIPLRMDGWTCGRCGATWSFFFHECPDCAAITRAGRLLDGRTWDQMPGAQP